MNRVIITDSSDSSASASVQVLLAIRGLGKSKTVMQQLPAEMRRPERGVIHLSQSH